MNHLAVKAHINQVEDYYGSSLPESVKYYIATQIELDLFVGEIISDLEESGMLEDTVIMLMNDHYPYTLNQEDYELASGKTNVHEKQRGSFIIWNKGIIPNKIDIVSSSFDILPTIASLFNLEIDYREYVGKDIFDETEDTLVFFKDYFVYDGDIYIDTLDPKNEYQRTVFAKTNPFYEYSIRVLKTNYYKTLD
jgi:lipoteichoic acid synthase